MSVGLSVFLLVCVCVRVSGYVVVSEDGGGGQYNAVSKCLPFFTSFYFYLFGN